MRIASSQFHSTMNIALQNASGRVEDTMQKMASGMRLLRPSDEPIASVRLSRLTREDAALTQYRDNIGALSTRLSSNEGYLRAMTQDMMQARDMLVWAADGGNTTQDVNAMADSLQSLRDSLFYSTNSKDQEGRYLFSGTTVSVETVTYDGTKPVGARYSFTGNTGVQNVVVGNGIMRAANVTLPEMQDLLNQIDSVIAALQAPTADVNNPATRATVKAGLDGFDSAMNSLGGKVADLGGAQNILSTLDSNHANVSLSNKQAYIELGQLDYGDASVKLTGYTTALQATQKAYAKISGLSLFDVL